MKKILVLFSFIAFSFLLLCNLSALKNGEFPLSDVIHTLTIGGSGSCNCPPGFQCVNDVCVQLEQATRESCISWQLCWTPWPTRIYCPGHEQNCPANPGGSENCSGYACQCDQDPC